MVFVVCIDGDVFDMYEILLVATGIRLTCSVRSSPYLFSRNKNHCYRYPQTVINSL